MIKTPFSKPPLTGKLGKLDVHIDPRTLRLMDVMRALPSIPPSYDVDSQFALTFPNSTFNNLVYSDCVIAEQGHQTLRMEAYEQHRVVNISAKNVTDNYFKQTGGADTGLYLLDALNVWRKEGWDIDQTVSALTKIKSTGCWHKKPTPPTPPVDTTKQHLSIAAFGAIDWHNYDHLNACIYLLNGVDIGVALPNTAKTQEVWDVVGDPNKDADSRPGSWGRHGIYVKAYHIYIPSHDLHGFVCMTWGWAKFMTERFWDAYIDEAYGVVDRRNLFTPNSPVDEAKLIDYLNQIA